MAYDTDLPDFVRRARQILDPIPEPSQRDARRAVCRVIQSAASLEDAGQLLVALGLSETAEAMLAEAPDAG